MENERRREMRENLFVDAILIANKKGKKIVYKSNVLFCLKNIVLFKSSSEYSKKYVNIFYLENERREIYS